MLKIFKISVIFKIFLTLLSISLSFVVFLVHKEIAIINGFHPYLSDIPKLVSYIMYFGIVFCATLVSIFFIRYLDSEKINTESITSIENANDNFLPSYLGYFFVALSISNCETFVFVFFIIGIFIYFSQIAYFNPMFFLLQYNFYFIENSRNIKILLISKKEIKDPKKVSFDNLKRVNNYTFFDLGNSDR